MPGRASKSSVKIQVQARFFAIPKFFRVDRERAVGTLSHVRWLRFDFHCLNRLRLQVPRPKIMTFKIRVISRGKLTSRKPCWVKSHSFLLHNRYHNDGRRTARGIPSCAATIQGLVRESKMGYSTKSARLVVVKASKLNSAVSRLW